MNHTLHILSLPHTQTTNEYLSCAYTQKVVKFCKMMKDMGNRVILYASEENDAPCDELVTVITRKEQSEWIGVSGPETLHNIKWDINLPFWTKFNVRVCKAIEKRKRKGDFICLITGIANSMAVTAFPDCISIEYGVGYEGVCAPFVCFESYAWMHSVYTSMYGSPFKCNGRLYDEVIPNYYDTQEFPLNNCRENKDGYYLYIGRLIDRKGIGIAVEACKRAGVKLIIAGNQGEVPKGNYIEYRGLVGIKERGELMSGAIATFVPTIYVEPFGGVAAESLLCGTPVITSEWGAFTDYVADGIDGYRCRMLNEFVWAVEQCKSLDNRYIRKRAQSKFSMNVIKYRYQDWLDKISGLFVPGGDWYNEAPYDPTNKRILGNF